MKYVHVASEKSLKSKYISQAIVRVTQNSLYSLIEGFRSQSFGLHSLNKVAHNIRKYTKDFVLPNGGQIMTDSGGYSIIKGDVHPSKIRLLLECYCLYRENEAMYTILSFR